MKKILGFIFASFMLTMLIAGCGKEQGKSVEIKDLTAYKDAVTDFTIQLPANWTIKKYPGDRVIAYTTQEVIKRFRNYDGVGDPGAKIEVVVQELNDKVTMDTLLAKKQFDPSIYSKPEKIKIDGVEGYKQSYSFELNDGKFEGEIYYFAKDPKLATIIDFEAFAGTFDTYKGKFHDILNSVKLAQIQTAKKDTVTKTKEAPPPSSNLVEHKGEGYKIMVPDNFSADRTKRQGTLYSVNYIGERRADCNILIDVKDASKQKDLKKIVDASAPKFGNASPKETSLGGEKAYILQYSPIKNVQSRVYFVMKNNKLFQITMNWNTTEEQAYKPIFEKSVNSLRFQ